MLDLKDNVRFFYADGHEDEELDFYKILGLGPETQRVTIEERMNDLTEEEHGIFNDLSEMMGE